MSIKQELLKSLANTLDKTLITKIELTPEPVLEAILKKSKGYNIKDHQKAVGPGDALSEPEWKRHIKSSPYAKDHQLHYHATMDAFEYNHLMSRMNMAHEWGKYGHKIHTTEETDPQDSPYVHVSVWSTPHSRARERWQIQPHEEYALHHAHGADWANKLDHYIPDAAHHEINRALKHVGLPERNNIQVTKEWPYTPKYPKYWPMDPRTGMKPDKK
jgi:hypothetical protein